MFDKIWDAHEVADGLIYVDLHLVHEVTSPQAFDGLRLEGRTVRRPDKTVATADHNVPTDGTPAARLIADELSRIQVETLERNCAEFGIPIYSLGSDRQGIVHVIGPELGLTQPGLVVVCGDSHTSTHGAFGALAVGIGTSEVEHVLATQCLVQKRPEDDADRLLGRAAARASTAKDLILATIGRLGVGGMVGHAVEYAGETIRRLSMENRMTICNMTIEGGGRAGHDRAGRDDLRVGRGSPGRPGGLRRRGCRVAATAHRRRRRVRRRGGDRRGGDLADGHLGDDSRDGGPGHRRGTRPGRVGRRARPTARPPSAPSPTWGWRPGRRCGRSRSTACSSAPAPTRASRICARRPRWSPEGSVAGSVRAMVVPGSQQVKSQAEDEGLDEVFRSAGFEWRTAGCSMCLGMNPDILADGERCASTSNRNFEGRQGKGGRTHLVSPEDGRGRGGRGALRGHQGVGDEARGCDREGRCRCSIAPTSTRTRSSPSSS